MYLEGDEITIVCKRISGEDAWDMQEYLNAPCRPEWMFTTVDYERSRVNGFLAGNRIYLEGNNIDGTRFELNPCEITSMLNFVFDVFGLESAELPMFQSKERVIYAARVTEVR